MISYTYKKELSLWRERQVPKVFQTANRHYGGFAFYLFFVK